MKTNSGRGPFESRLVPAFYFLQFLLQDVAQRASADYLCPSKCQRDAMWPRIKRTFGGINCDIYNIFWPGSLL